MPLPGDELHTDGFAIKVEGASRRFGDVAALDGLDLVVEEGALFGLLGPNGAGKTTLINLLSGLQKADRGICRVLGRPVPERLDEVKPLMGVCPQSGAVALGLTGQENVELFGVLYGLPKDEAKARANTLLERMGLGGDAGRKAGGYSEGMKRRLSVAMALVHDPRLAFLDEPTVGMDPQSRRAVWDFLLELKGDGKTVVLTTHYMEEAEQLCDMVGIIDHGRLIEQGAPRELIASYGKRDLEEVFMHLTGRKMREEGA